MDKQTLKVASLNFSGINNSYFQYNDGSVLFEGLNRNYKLIKNAQFKDMKKWIGAELERNYKTARFTVLFGEELSSLLEDKLFNKQQFEINWRKVYEEALQNNKLTRSYKATPEEEQDVMKMDYSFYRAVIMTVYEINSLQGYEGKVSQLNPVILKQFLDDFRKKPRFQLQAKRRAVEYFYQTMDLVFLQEAGSVEWKLKECYDIVQNSDSHIIFKPEIFGKVDQKETDLWKDKFNINKDSVCVITDKRYLLISSHFRGSSPGFLENQEELMRELNNCYQYYQSRKEDLKIIVGADANHYISAEKQLLPGLELYPSDKKDFTTHKKRSFIQAQVKKADLAVNEVKDHIITNMSIREKYVSMIDGKQSENQLLPNDRHPYDHFIVAAYLEPKSIW